MEGNNGVGDSKSIRTSEPPSLSALCVEHLCMDLEEKMTLQMQADIDRIPEV